MPAPSPPTQLDAKAYNALGVEPFNALNDFIREWERANERPLDAAGVDYIIATMFGEGDDSKIARGLARQQLDILLRRKHVPTSKESLELLEADRKRDIENARVGFVTEWIKILATQDQRRTATDQLVWQFDYANLDSKTEAKFGIDGKLAIVAEAKAEVAKMTIPR